LEVLTMSTQRDSRSTRLEELASHVGAEPDELLEAFAHVLAGVPHSDRGAPHSLTVTEESEYRLAGGLHAELPDLPDRASTATLQRRFAIARESLSTVDAARLLNVTDSRIRQRINAGTLRAVKYGRGWRVLACQFADDREVPGIGRVVESIPRDVPAVTVDTFFTTPSVDLLVAGEAVTPRDWLLAGRDVGAVVELGADLDRLP
jgi:excisionase family DNA binding protein